MTRRWSSLAFLLAAAVLTAGCTKDEGDGQPTTSTPPTGGTTTTPPTTPGGGNSTTPPPASPAPVTDAGAIQGEFTKSWTLTVPALSPRAVTVLFNLTGAQAGAPPTAKVHMEFVAPDGSVLKSTDVGLGGSGNAVSWTFGPADVQATGDYVVRATAAASPVPGGPGLPSGGIANYDFYGAVEY
jgi:hypothetical protein